MELLSLLYTLFIGPLQLLFEFVFSVAHKACGNCGISIIVLSVVMNLLALPLYRRADEIQKAETEKRKAIAPREARIKKAFQGDERFMMLQNYYRENDIKPTDSLKGSLSLLLQIPFFIAAYRMLSSLELLKGTGFLFLNDLGSPDGLLSTGSLSVNILPFVMTAINLVSGFIYLKGADKKTKIQTYGITVIFLVLLYNSPSGLVFYWICNNIFSLIKNLIPFDKIPKIDERKFKYTKKDNIIFVLCSIYNSVLLGLLIPSAVISSSTAGFVLFFRKANPGIYLWYSLAMAAGIFVIWFGVFYAIGRPPVKRILTIVSVISVFLFSVDYFVFGKEYGILEITLYYYSVDMNPADFIVLSLALVMLICLLVIFFAKYIWKLLSFVLAAAVISITIVCCLSVVHINNKYAELDYMDQLQGEPELRLSRTGHNVVIIMLDRAQGFLVPYCFNEFPELQDQYDGFTYYSNTVSFGGHTNIASPALYGGYEYTPTAMNARPDERLVDKHNEALMVMPVLFRQNGFDVTVSDQSYAGYQEIPDLTIYADYPGIDTYITNGRYNSLADEQYNDLVEIWKRDFFCYSFFRVMPPALHSFFYDNGNYHSVDRIGAEFRPASTLSGNRAVGFHPDLLDSLSVLDSFPDMTVIADNDTGCFNVIANEATHSPMILREPDYVPEYNVDNTEYDEAHSDRFDLGGQRLEIDNYIQLSSYQVNMAAYLRIGEWLDYLREQGVYDNTRIIIVSDHGSNMDILPSLRGEGLAAEFFNPVLLVKDFDSHGFTICDELMTNADTPFIATEGLIEDPVNPFTGYPLSDDPKTGDTLLIFDSHEYDVEENNGNVFIPGPWYTVNGDILQYENWEYLGEW